MAEAWARQLAGDTIEAVSAGIVPLGFIAPETVEVMEEKNVSLTGQRSKDLLEIDWKTVDVLVNMSGMPGRSVVPAFAGRRVEWKVADPYGEPLDDYRRVRDEIERNVRRLLAEWAPAAAAKSSQA